jgi:hypothetical protein
MAHQISRQCFVSVFNMENFFEVIFMEQIEHQDKIASPHVHHLMNGLTLFEKRKMICRSFRLNLTTGLFIDAHGLKIQGGGGGTVVIYQ